MPKSITILTIGSLFWSEEDPRPSWRRDHLAVELATRVRVPIRYGRKSNKSGYTMVFSTGLPTEHFGWALAVPCRSVVDTFEQFNEEAEALWAAERKKASPQCRIASNWGAVGLLANPNRAGLDLEVAKWSARVSVEHDIYKYFPHGKDEASAVTPSGFLAIPWPVTESGQSLDCDFVLATPTALTPENGTYAAPPQIAAAFRSAENGRRYFDRNRDAGIFTAFDDEILQCLNSTG